MHFNLHPKIFTVSQLVGNVAQWLGRQSFAGGLSPIYA